MDLCPVAVVDAEPVLEPTFFDTRSTQDYVYMLTNPFENSFMSSVIFTVSDSDGTLVDLEVMPVDSTHA